jgi:hypothetical protein
MKSIPTLTLAVLAMAAAACDKTETSGSAASAAGSGKPPLTANATATAASATPTASAAGSAAAVPADANICQKKGMAKGTGSVDEPCEFEGEILKLKNTGKKDSIGRAIFSVTNPWPDEISYVVVDAFYYDKSGKQIELKLKDGKHKYASCSGGCLTLPPNGTIEAGIGADKDGYPADAETVEAEISRFGWGANEEKKRAEAYFENPKIRGWQWKDARPKGGLGQ